MINLLNSLFIFLIKLMPKSLVSIFAMQYVAGENIDDVLKVVSKLNKNGFKTTIDILGEHSTDNNDIIEIVSEYNELYKQINQRNLDANLSIKPTHIGLDISYVTALLNFTSILNLTEKYNNFLRIDMESSSATDNTLRLYRKLINIYNNVGIVFQSYLRRTYDDLNNIDDKINLNFRLCKGIYMESENIAFKNYNDINNNYLKILEYAFKNNIYVGIATHDKKLIDKCYDLIDKYNIDKDRFEFQVLYGVPMGGYLEKHKENNYAVRVYVPYGKEWYKYSIRRMKENPNIVKYVLKNLFKR